MFTTNRNQSAQLASYDRHAALPPLLKSFQFWTVALFLFSWFFHLIAFFVFHAHGHLVYPLSLNAHDRFLDFTIFVDKFKFFHSAEFFQTGFPINYPAPVCILFEVFFRYAAPHEVMVFVSFCVLSFVVPAYLFGRCLAKRGIRMSQAMTFAAVLCLLSWPGLLIVDGGNAEVFVWLALLIAMWAYATGHEWVAACFFGIAASMKLFPIVFLALFLSRKRLGQLLAGIVTFFVVSIASLKILGPTVAIAYRGIAFGLVNFKRNYMAMWHTGENGVDHSLFATFKGALYVVFHHPSGDFTGWLQIYLVATAIGGVALYFLHIRKLPLLNQVLSLSIISIYFTAFSGDGTLIHLYYPLGMLFLLAIQAWHDGKEIPGLRLILACMVATLSMESFLVVPFRGESARLIGPFHCLCLGVMLIAALRYRLGPPLAENRGEIILSQPVTEWTPVRPGN